MSKIINIISNNSFGGTFLDWSLHYLSGHEGYYGGLFNHREFKYRLLLQTPLSSINAHGHIKNHPEGSIQYVKTISQLNAVKSDEFHVLYAYALKNSKCTDYKELWKIACETGPTVLLTNNNNSVFSLFTDVDVMRSDSSIASNSFKTIGDFMTFYFSEDQKRWADLGLTKIWDIREFMALNRRPFNQTVFDYDLTTQHIAIQVSELMNSFDLTVNVLFDKIGIAIDHNRLQHWKEVYASWKEIHYKNFLWIWYFDQIINYIVNGYSMDLDIFDLNITKESTIQHTLIYQYDLNLKTWNLEKFPSNTRDIHALLEPNTHIIEKYNI
jgi:hypothetical protein